MSKPEMNLITPDAKKSFMGRLLVVGPLLAIIGPAIFIGDWFFFVVVGLFLGISVYEMINATGKKYPWYLWVFSYIIVFSFVYWFVFKDIGLSYRDFKMDGDESFVFNLGQHFGNLDISFIGVAVAIGVYLLMGIIGHHLTFSDVAYFITFSIILGLGYQAALFIRYYPSFLYLHFSSPEATNALPISIMGLTGDDLVNNVYFKYLIGAELLIFVVLGVTMNDTFAYVFGMVWGKHKLNEKVSPNKTWEGFFGGWLMGTIACLAFGLPLTFCGFPMLPTLGPDNWYWVVILSLVIPLFGDLGDLGFSFIKRHYGIKDFGTVLKGHGGVIDRMGSEIFGCLGTAAILIFLTNGWDFLI
jgi:CDP-diglyceride synthetase